MFCKVFSNEKNMNVASHPQQQRHVPSKKIAKVYLGETLNSASLRTVCKISEKFEKRFLSVGRGKRCNINNAYTVFNRAKSVRAFFSFGTVTSSLFFRLHAEMLGIIFY